MISHCELFNSYLICNGVVTLNCNKKKHKMANEELLQGFYTL